MLTILRNLTCLPLFLACCSSPARVVVPVPEPLSAGSGNAVEPIGEPRLENKASAVEKENYLGLSLGGSSERNGSNGLTLGANYEHRFTPQLGFGGFAELTSGNLRDLAIGAVGFFHPAKGLTLVAGPGLEYEHSDWHGLFRIGGFYAVPLESGWVLGPALYYDFTSRKDVLVYAITVGTSF